MQFLRTNAAQGTCRPKLEGGSGTGLSSVTRSLAASHFSLTLMRHYPCSRLCMVKAAWKPLPAAASVEAFAKCTDEFSRISVARRNPV